MPNRRIVKFRGVLSKLRAHLALRFESTQDGNNEQLSCL